MSIEHFLNDLKAKAAFITTTFSLITLIGGSILYFETTYAHAADLQEIIQNQKTQIKLYEKSQRQQSLFQLEYYDDRTRKLLAELAQAQKTKSSAMRSIPEIQNDINDTKQRRDIVRQQITTE